MGGNARACSLGGREENVVYGWEECEVRKKEGSEIETGTKGDLLLTLACEDKNEINKIYIHVYIYICSHACIIVE